TRAGSPWIARGLTRLARGRARRGGSRGLEGAFAVDQGGEGLAQGRAPAPRPARNGPPEPAKRRPRKRRPRKRRPGKRRPRKRRPRKRRRRKELAPRGSAKRSRK